MSFEGVATLATGGHEMGGWPRWPLWPPPAMVDGMKEALTRLNTIQTANIYMRARGASLEEVQKVAKAATPKWPRVAALATPNDGALR